MHGNKIREIRKKQKITLIELSESTGISAGYICHLEKGTRKNPSAEVMKKISLALNKNVYDIFFTD